MVAYRLFKIFVVEDDPIILNVLRDSLSKWDFEVLSVEDFQQVDKEILEAQPHLVLMDISLPSQNGYHWCQQVRMHSDVPIVFLSSSSEDMNLVMAMSLGADDFIVKPFSVDVLTAKIQALLRRTYTYESQNNIMQYKDFMLDMQSMIVSMGENKIELTKNEFQLLQLLFQSPGKVINRDEMMRKLWDTDSFIDDNTLTVNITRLRKKIEELSSETDIIQTKRGVGYYVEK